MIRPRSLVLAAALAALPVFASTAEAGNWIFMPSPLSDAPPLPPVPSPAARARGLGGPYFTRPAGGYVSVARRYLNSTISVRGRTVDQYYLWETSVQGGGQF